ncbi:hypothetical protein OUZ56_002408 [Daphnia magna]|uniref:Uncharacterized protein n=1 Tax=Daphnia magna TaxID=35525 RepID=A0ABR0A5V4_9CRUS|nr:hypothetical protein OUZ56_002408 [Daphnia magna]
MGKVGTSRLVHISVKDFHCRPKYNLMSLDKENQQPIVIFHLTHSVGIRGQSNSLTVQPKTLQTSRHPIK